MQKDINQKIAFLKDQGFDMQECGFQSGSVAGIHNELPLGITLCNDRMEIDKVTHMQASPIHIIDGWEGMSISGFKMLCYSLGLIAIEQHEFVTCVQLAEHQLQFIPGALS